MSACLAYLEYESLKSVLESNPIRWRESAVAAANAISK